MDLPPKKPNAARVTPTGFFSTNGTLRISHPHANGGTASGHATTPSVVSPSSSVALDDIVSESWCTRSLHCDSASPREDAPFGLNASVTLTDSQTFDRSLPPTPPIRNGYSHADLFTHHASNFHVAEVRGGGADVRSAPRENGGHSSDAKSSSKSQHRKKSRLAIMFSADVQPSGSLKNGGGSASGAHAVLSSSAAGEVAARTFEELSREHFPITLGAGTDVVKSRPGSGSRSMRADYRDTRLGSSARSSASSNSTSSLDRGMGAGIYLMDDRNNISSPPLLMMSSPYETNLTQLRLEKLRIEEENLLELKRQQELERIRGPQVKWYMMRSSGFHQELRKNNELMKNRPAWQAMYDYRTKLEQASRKFHESGSNSLPSGSDA